MLIRKIGRIILKTLVGVFVFYLFVALIAIPVVVPLVVRSQAAKALKHEVGLRSVQFNPFLLRLSVYGLQIKDKQKQVMAGFDSLSVDVSFLRLFKKEYRVESVKLAGLQVNVALQPGNKINLLELAPASPQQPPPQPQQPVDKNNTTQKIVQPLPLVIIDNIALTNGQVTFTDQTLTPNFVTSLSGMDMSITGFSTKPDSKLKLDFKTKLDKEGMINIEAFASPFASPIALETAFTLNNYALTVLTPYVGKYTGRAVGDGKLDIRMDYRIANNQLSASHKLKIQKFGFGQKVESKDALNLPFGLAVALLEDPQGRISISLPMSGDISKPDFKYWPLVGQVASNFFLSLVTKPFMYLLSAMGADTGTQDVGYIVFAPGKSDLIEAEQKKVALFVKSLSERPKLSLEINGSYDPVVDWKVLRAEAIKDQYEKLRKESTRSEYWIYRQLYQHYFGLDKLWALTNAARLPKGRYDEAKIDAQIRLKLIEDSPADKNALELLAQQRAQALYDLIIKSGFDPKRISIGKARTTQSVMDKVPLEFTFTVFGE